MAGGATARENPAAGLNRYRVADKFVAGLFALVLVLRGQRQNGRRTDSQESHRWFRHSTARAALDVLYV
jgi:hypothetical protein